MEIIKLTLNKKYIEGLIIIWYGYGSFVGEWNFVVDIWMNVFKREQMIFRGGGEVGTFVADLELIDGSKLAHWLSAPRFGVVCGSNMNAAFVYFSLIWRK